MRCVSAMPAAAHARSSKLRPQFLFDERVRIADIDKDFIDGRTSFDERDSIVLAPCGLVFTKITTKRLLSPRHLRRCNDRGKGGDAAETIGIAKGDR